MKVSRRQFLKTSGVTASVPLVTTLAVNSSAAAPAFTPDLSLGYEANAVRMNLNENPLGPPAAAVAAAQAAIPYTNRYVSPALLKKLLGDFHGMPAEWMLVGNGSTEMLKLVTLGFTPSPAYNMVSARETWSTTPKFAANLGADIRYVKLLRHQVWEFDVDSMLSAVDSNTGIFFVVNPNNPTGAMLSFEQLKQIADTLPPQVLFIIDEAYAQYTPGVKTGFDLLKQGYKNILVTRPFSKAHGLAALRCGYGAGHPDILRKITRFGCDAASLNIGGYAALQATLADSSHLQSARDLASEINAFYKVQCEELGLPIVTGSHALPFVLIELGNNAGSIQQQLENRNIFVRHVESWGLPKHIRVSGGLKKHNQRFFSELKKLI